MNMVSPIIARAETNKEAIYYDQLHAEKYRDEGQTKDQHSQTIANNLASDPIHKVQLYNSLKMNRFLPAGRIQAALGATEREVSPFNCSVSQRIEDSMDSIMAALSNAAKILRLGTGIGYNFSNLRPRGAEIKKLRTQSSGPLSFMKMFDVMASTIASSGHRRGAQMGILNCFAGNTKVHTLLQGKVEIKDLVGTNPILYCVKNGKISVEKADSIHKSGEKRVITVILDNDTEITCTPEHLFMLANGSYIEASKLKTYDSLMAIKKKLSNKYLYVGCTGNRSTKAEHLIVYESLYGKIPEGHEIHHKDFNRHNNSPDNLQGLTGEEYTDKYHNGFSNQFGSATNIDFLEDIINNHKVLRIEDRGEICEVYDITMPSTHNFFVEEICVHNCNHPDIEEFINAKMEKGAYRQFNFSVGITDEFMEAVAENADWPMSFNGRVEKVAPARQIWGNITRNAFESAEPGLIFIDRLNDQNNLHYCEEIEGTNPCAEQPLPPYGLCTLGSFNLVGYLLPDGISGWKFDNAQFKRDIAIWVEAYDNIFEKANYAIPEHRQEALSKRRIGLGLTGIANAIELIIGRKSYGDDDFCTILNNICETLKIEAYQASVNLAKDRGSFELFDAQKYLQGNFIQSLPASLQESIFEHGIRNSHLISYAPCGTISQCAGNVSSGVEPVFYNQMTRDVYLKEGKVNVTLNDWNFKNYQFSGRTLSECSVDNHMSVADTIQRHCDSAISKTVNVSPNCSYEEYSQVYIKAHEMGLKGITVYRPSEIRGAVIAEAPSNCANGACER